MVLVPVAMRQSLVPVALKGSYIVNFTPFNLYHVVLVLFVFD